MNDSQLNEILKRGAVPEPPADFWERIPGRVMARAQWRNARETTVPDAPAGARFPILATGLAVSLVIIAFFFLSGHRSAIDSKQLAQAQKYFHELEALFPNQLESIVFDADGPHLSLASRPNIPSAKALYLKVCGPKGCKSYVTFSGQQIHLDGDVCDVLVDHRGNVLLVGDKLVWSSAGEAKAGGYRVQARTLERAS